MACRVVLPTRRAVLWQIRDAHHARCIYCEREEHLPTERCERGTEL